MGQQGKPGVSGVAGTEHRFLCLLISPRAPSSDHSGGTKPMDWQVRSQTIWSVPKLTATEPVRWCIAVGVGVITGMTVSKGEKGG